MEVSLREAENNNGGLCFKLKIMNPKPEPITTDHPDDQDMKINEENPELLPFVCPVCKNRFKSGKALGGHKRMHNLPPSKLKLKIENNKANTNTSSVLINKRKRVDHDHDENKEGEEDEPICLLCDKIFPSMKSLFGHMRSHPDRGWKGIQPPPAVAATNNNKNSSILTQDDVDNDSDDSSPMASPKRRQSSNSPKTPPPPPPSHDLDLLKSLKKGNWSVTAKRGSCKSSSSSSASSAHVGIPGVESSMREAVLDLMDLADPKPNARADLLTILQRIKDDINRKKQEKQKEEENLEEEGYYIMKKVKDNKVMKTRIKKMKLVHDPKQEDIEEDEPEEEEEEEEEEGAGGGQATMLTAGGNGGGGEYICSDCKRPFPSYQALGGHRSSHNKKNIIINNHKDDDDLSRSADEKAAIDDHRDDDGAVEDNVSAENDGGKNFLDFDLNEPPPSEG